MENFESFELSPEVLANIKAAGFEKPSKVQIEAIPAIKTKQDVVIQSHTGSGKTAAFGLPLLDSVMKDVPAVQFLVLVPTRELALQVHDELARLAAGTGVRLAAVYGGASIKAQEDALRKGAQVVVATPGRTLDHIKRRNMSLSIVRGIVLDEADKMLSMGFLPDVRLIFKHLPKRRQVIMSSATFPLAIEAIIDLHMIDPLRIAVSSDKSTAKEIDHFYCIVPHDQKERTLLNFIEKEDPELSFIFCNTKSEVKSVYRFLADADLDVLYLSSDLSQKERERALKKIRHGRVSHLVCTDVAARGIDVPKLSHVFLFSPPEDAETYVHRTGRTGRAGRAGKAIAIVSGQDVVNFNRALKLHEIKSKEITPPDLAEIRSNRAALHMKTLEEIGFAHDADVREEVGDVAKQLSQKQVQDLLPFLLEFFLRNHNKPIFEEVEQPPPPLETTPSDAQPDHSPSGKPRSGGKKGHPADTRPGRAYAKVCVALGYEDGVRKRDLEGIMLRQGRARKGDVGDIELGEFESFVDVDRRALRSILKADGQFYKGLELFIKNVAGDHSNTEEPAEETP